MEERKETMKRQEMEEIGHMEVKQKNICIQVDGEEPVFILVLEKSKLGWKPKII